MERTPLGIRAYRSATTALSPVARLVLQERAVRGKEDRARLQERLGYTDAQRPPGTLIWIHGASVGESLAALPLLEVLLKPGRSALVTSGTVTSAQLMAERLPQGAIHQFAPIDTLSAVTRFLDHWKPDVGLFIDSDLWPNLILAAKERGVRLGLVNARMSARSAEGWRYAPATAAALMRAFDACLAQNEEVAARFRTLGAQDVRVTGSLKADAPPLPADPGKLDVLKLAIGSRPVFLAASTHPGEDETLLPAHDTIRQTHRDLLTIIVPRHPDRGAEVAMLCGTRSVRRRSDNALPSRDTAIYVADTMGELGLFYRTAPFAFMGGSLIQHGGQNPLEPARLHCAVIAGPHTDNFVEAYDAIFSAQECGRIATSGDIAAFANRVLGDPSEARRLGDAAFHGAEKLGGAVGKTAEFVETLLAGDARA
ncbi:MAG TPA: 3-deoxy-D-manno-octulosonic acid transferase [Rhizomicrobium sp.]|jgi:3-deoxy-D-manno-octulosonic-acid transferase|nr:3-deoxy-D-manno-octulosonic acid transferase [Rhizomicrobium sp.]